MKAKFITKKMTKGKSISLKPMDKKMGVAIIKPIIGEVTKIILFLFFIVSFTFMIWNVLKI